METSITPPLPEPVPPIQSSFPEPPSSSRCLRCNPPNGHNPNTRNLVVCIDGTSNRFGKSNTNVVKLFAKIDLDTTSPKQFAYYSSGIGTRASAWNVSENIGRAISDKFDMAVAWNVKEIVKDVYGWLARMYQEGDRIYLFGFSRGAYQVRVLAGMIHEVGLIRTHTEKQVVEAYDHFRVIDAKKPKTRQIAREFKTTFSWKDVGVHFVGVWDTVSSVGLIRGDIFLSTSSSAAHACHFRHALALDERRVKFMPEYFHEMNPQTSGGKSKYIVPSDIEGFTSPTRKATIKTDFPVDKKEETTEIKEVWLAGCHSDVGGKTRSGKSRQAGNVSLVWMRREAIESGLKLQPTDIVWVPDDIDFGTKDSMRFLWKIVEYIPIKHQVSFSGPGEDRHRRHRQRPRRILPGQKVHASVLYANTYRPRAKLGEGFDIPVIRSDDTKLNDQIWETGMFDGTAAEALLEYLDKATGVAPIYLDRLLFMLRFEEGKKCVKSAKNSRRRFMDLIRNPQCASLVKLVAIVAYYEAFHDSDVHPGSCAVADDEQLSQDVFDVAKKSFQVILAPKHRDNPRALALLRPLTRHQILRERILTEDILGQLMNLFDTIVDSLGFRCQVFEQAVDGLICLLQCKDKREIIVDKLASNYPPDSEVTRLSRILRESRNASDSRLQATLRMVLTLAQIPAQEVPKARRVCSTVKRTVASLARNRKGPTGLLAVGILMALYDSNDRWRLRSGRLNSWFNPSVNIRTNVANTLRQLAQRDSGNEDGLGADPGRQVLCHMFGFDVESLNDEQKWLIKELAGRRGVKSSDTQRRTTSTLTLLKLCETKAIRDYLCETGLVQVFIEQLRRRKDCALLAAYALAICTKYIDMMKPIKDSELLPKYIVRMIQLDYFDDALGPVEGFQIFGHLMQDGNEMTLDLRKKIMDYKVPVPICRRLMQRVFQREKTKNYSLTEILQEKLRMGTPKEVRTSLICLDIIRSFDENNHWTDELIENSLEKLRKPDWYEQKAGVIILSALAQTDHGVARISPRIIEIIRMLLPEEYSPILSPSTTFPSEAQIAPAAPAEPEPSSRKMRLLLLMQRILNQHIGYSTDKSKPSSWMLGPACALRVLAQHAELRRIVRETTEYGTLKDLHLSGILVNEKNTKPWNVYTPNSKDIVSMLDKMIKAVDQEQSEEGLWVGDDILPRIRHWRRLIILVYRVVVGIPLSLLFVPTLIATIAIGLALEAPLIAVLLSISAVGAAALVALTICALPILAVCLIFECLCGIFNRQPENEAPGDEGEQSKGDGAGAAPGRHTEAASPTEPGAEGTFGGGHESENSKGDETEPMQRVSMWV